MRNRAVGAVLKSVRTLLDVGTLTGLSDSQLLERYLPRADDAAESAFRALVERHGPMVFRVCRAVLHDTHAAEDAFQATFLILARKAGSIRDRDSVASWLFGVARRVAGRAKTQRNSRAAQEREAIAMAHARAASSERPPESSPEIQEEVDRLPERYRAPIVLCYLEGLTQEEAARRLRLPASTVRVRLMRARARLRDRLIRRGLAPAALAGLATRRAEAAIPAPLVEETIKAAVHVAVGRAVGVSAPVAALVEGVIRVMFFAQLKMAAALLAALTFASLLMISTLAGPTRSEQDPAVEKHPQAAPTAGRTKPGDEGREVSVATVNRSDSSRATIQTGNVTAFESVNVYTRTSGYLTRLTVDIGTRVKRGELLAELFDPELAVAVEKAQAEVGRARARVKRVEAAIQVAHTAADVEHAKVQAAAGALEESEAKVHYHEKRLSRLRDLEKNRSIPQQLVDEAEAQYESTRAGSNTARAQLVVAQAAEVETRAKIEAAKADVEEARSDLRIAEAGQHNAEIIQGYMRVISPFDGIVTRRNYHAGAFVRSANVGNVDPIVTIVRTDLMRVVVLVPDSEVPFLDLGDPAKVRIDSLGARGLYRGRIARTAYALDIKDRTLLAEIDLPNADGRLRPGQSGRVEIDLEATRNALTIPNSAVVDQGAEGAAVCYRVVASRAVRTPIKLGQGDSRRVEVIEGLKEGDIVIADPDERMPDGQAVTIRRERHEPAAR